MTTKSHAAERAAQTLAAWFLARGCYAAAPSLKGGARAGLLPAAAARDPDFDAAAAAAGFAGLAVQAVGHGVGGPPTVHVYLSRAPRRLARALPAVAGRAVAVEPHRLGKLLVKPDESATAARGHLFVRGGRVACGSSCAPAGEAYAGTAGALVRTGRAGGLYVLSNNHILAAGNHTPVGMPVLAPAPLDAGPDRPAPAEIARHAVAVPLRSGEPTSVPPCREDVALARVVDPDRVTSWQGDPDAGYDTPTAVAPLRSGQAVQKVGRTTGRTTGVVEAKVGTPTPLQYRLKLFTAQVWVRDFWTVAGDDGEPFAEPGDSGSLVVTADGAAAVGLVFACGDGYALVTPIARVLACLGGLTLVGRHGLGP